MKLRYALRATIVTYIQNGFNNIWGMWSHELQVITDNYHDGRRGWCENATAHLGWWLGNPIRRPQMSVRNGEYLCRCKVTSPAGTVKTVSALAKIRDDKTSRLFCPTLSAFICLSRGRGSGDTWGFWINLDYIISFRRWIQIRKDVFQLSNGNCKLLN